MRALALMVGVILVAGCSSEETTPRRHARSHGDADTSADGLASDAMNAGDDRQHNGDSTPPGSDSVDFGDSLPPAGTVLIAESCSGFTPCGGNVVGQWYYSNVCLPAGDLLSQLSSICANPTLNAYETNAFYGTLDITSTTVTRNVLLDIALSVNFPTECVVGTCDLMAMLLTSAGYEATCTTGTGCDCSFAYAVQDSETLSYTLSGQQMVVGGTSTYDYCVAGSLLAYHDVTASGAVPGFYALMAY